MLKTSSLYCALIYSSISMAGTYNEVKLLKLGKHKKPAKDKKRATSSPYSIRGNDSEPQSRSSTDEMSQSHLNPMQNQTNTGTQPQPQNSVPSWPPSLTSFVNDCFVRSVALSDLQKVVFNQQLQSLLAKAMAESKLWTNNWAQQRLPIFDGVPLELECDGFKKRSEVSDGKFDSASRKKQRMARFGDSLTPEPQRKTYQPKNKVIVGTCTDLEKNYLRLTSEPDPSRVRPEKVLVKSMEFVLNKYHASGAPYSYVNTQFKSIRQDLTVQHIQSDLTLRVYEAHARIALENADLGEFNQCQSQLKYLYNKKRQIGAVSSDFHALELEFTCYRILYMLMTNNHSDIFKTRMELLSLNIENRTTREEDLAGCIEKAFGLHDYMVQGDYHGFFEGCAFFKHLDIMKTGYCLLQQSLMDRERVKALNVIVKAYRKVPLVFLQLELAFEDDTKVVEFFEKHKLKQCIANNEFDCVSGRPVVQSITVGSGFRKIDIKGQI